MHARTRRALFIVLFAAPLPLHAQTVQLSLHDGRVSIVASRATPAEILQAWSREGNVTLVNAERVSGTPVTLRLDDVPEEQALDMLLREAGGYLARRRNSPARGSVFDRIVVTPVTAAVPAPAAASAAAPALTAPVFPQAWPPVASSGIPVAPGVMRLVGPDGQPVADDQDDPPRTAVPAATRATPSPGQPRR